MGFGLPKQEAQERELSRRTAWTALLLLVLAGSGLRLWRIGQKELWLDECISAIAARGTVAETIGNVAREDAHPAAYYGALNLATRITGDDEAGLRLPSAVASIGCIVLTYAIGAALLNRTAGLLAAAGMAVSSFQLYFAQEARLHALVTLLVLALTYVFVRLLAGSGASLRAVWPWVVAYGALTALSVYTYYYAVFAVVAHAAVFLVLWGCSRASCGAAENSGGGPRWVLRRCEAGNLAVLLFSAAMLGGVLFAVGWGRVVLDRLHAVGGTPAERIGLYNAADALRHYLTGPVADRMMLAAQRRGAGFPLAEHLIGLAVLPFVAALCASRRAPGAVVCLILMVAVPFLCAAVLPARPHVFGPKHLVFVVPFVFLLLAAPAVGPRARLLAGAALLLLVPLNAFFDALYFDPAYHKEPWRAVAREIRRGARPGDVIVVTPGYAEHPLSRYLSSERIGRVVQAPFTGVNTVRDAARTRPPGVWLVQLSSDVARPNREVGTWLAAWENPDLAVPDAREVSWTEWYPAEGALLQSGSVGILLAHWRGRRSGEQESVSMGPVFEGFTSGRTTITVRRFAPKRATGR